MDSQFRTLFILIPPHTVQYLNLSFSLICYNFLIYKRIESAMTKFINMYVCYRYRNIDIDATKLTHSARHS